MNLTPCISLRSTVVMSAVLLVAACEPPRQASPERVDSASRAAPAPSRGSLGEVRFEGARCAIVDDAELALRECVPFGDAWKASVERQADGSEILVVRAGAIEVPSGTEVYVETSRPVALVAERDLRVDGSILLLRYGADEPSAGGHGPGKGGPGGGAPGVSGAAGGGGAYCGRGGRGGGEGAGAPGRTYGDPSLVVLAGGSAGGGEYGGRGGGALRLEAGGTVSIGRGGVVSAPGGGAAGGSKSGGGSGGAIAIVGDSVTIAGVVAANGGAGNMAVDYIEAANGLPSTSRATTGSIAGDGSAGADIDGRDGAFDRETEGSEGGGGGGAGRIRITARTGRPTVTTTATISPALGTACAPR
ncbi:MAG: hypothetical protein JST00_44405 [Deltaproteobacteria bacterium]|nr:hypothetical protein [Deltaproteobacteria bacterium]